MTYNLPAHGEPDWDAKLDPTLQYLKDTAEAAETTAGAQAKATAAQNAAVATAATDAQNKADAARDAAISAAATDATTKANSVQSALNTHAGNLANPHSVTKAQVGLGNVDNTADADKPVSTATQAALDAKQNHADMDTDVASAVSAGTQTGAALRASYETAGAITPRRNRTRGVSDSLNSFVIAKKGAILPSGTGWKETYVFLGGDVVRDPVTQHLALVYSCYGTTVGRQAIGLAYSDDGGMTWTDYGSNPILDANTISGTPDYGGGTFPQLVWDGSQWHMFYIGFDGRAGSPAGFENGTASVCRATAATLTGPWTRHGAVVSPQPGSWAPGLVYRPCVIEHGGTWYMFTNGATTPGVEVIGYASAPSLTGTWTLAANPIIDSTTTGRTHHSDPDVFRIDDTFYCLYWGYNGSEGTYGLYLASCDVASFPDGPWADHGQVMPPLVDNSFANNLIRPVTFFTPSGLSVLVCQGGYPTSMDVLRSGSAPRTPGFDRVDWNSSGGGNGYLWDNSGVSPAPWHDLYPSSPTLTLYCKPGDVVEVHLSAFYNNEASNGCLDVVSVVGGAEVNSWALNAAQNGTSQGVQSWGGQASVFSHVGGSVARVVTANDLEQGGKLTLKLTTRTVPAGTKSITINDANPFTMWARVVA